MVSPPSAVQPTRSLPSLSKFTGTVISSPYLTSKDTSSNSSPASKKTNKVFLSK